MYNPLHAAGKVTGFIIMLAFIGALVWSGSWGPLAFLAVMTPIVGLLEIWARPDLYTKRVHWRLPINRSPRK
jgi:hypothetical protein